MGTVTIRELRNRGGEVVDRVAAGERITVTRDGRPVAELRPVRAGAVNARELLGRWRRLPHVDPVGARERLDRVLDPRL